MSFNNITDVDDNEHQLFSIQSLTCYSSLVVYLQYTDPSGSEYLLPQLLPPCSVEVGEVEEFGCCYRLALGCCRKSLDRELRGLSQGAT